MEICFSRHDKCPTGLTIVPNIGQDTSPPQFSAELVATLPPLPLSPDLLSESIDLYFPPWQQKLQAHLESLDGRTGSTISTVQNEILEIVDVIARNSGLKIPKLGGIDCAGLVDETFDVISYLDREKPTSIGQVTHVAGGQIISLDWEVLRKLIRNTIEDAQPLKQ